MINGGFKLSDEKELIVNPLECEVATATPVAKEPKAFFNSVSLNSMEIRFNSLELNYHRSK